MDATQLNELHDLIGQLVIALLAMAATFLPAWAINIWRKAIAVKLVQDAILWAARSAVASLLDDKDSVVRTPGQAIKAATETVAARVPDALKTVGVKTDQDLRELVQARVKALIAGLVK